MRGGLRRAGRILLYAVLVVAVAFGGLVGYLISATAKPRFAEGWTRLPDMPVPHGEVASTVLLTAGVEELVLAGGIGGLGRTVRDVWRFSPDENRWFRGLDIPQRRHHAGAAALSGTVYVSGGSESSTNWAPERNFWALRAGASRWEELPVMPEGRMGHKMVTVGNRLYVVGGRGGPRPLIFNAETGTWHRAAPMPQPRDHLGAAVVGSRIWAIGGRDDEVLKRVDIYDAETNTWTPGPDLPAPMSAMAVGVLDDGIHVVGGEEPGTFGGKVIDRHFMIDPNVPGARWQEAPRPVLAVHGAASGVVFGKLVIAGGSRRQGALSVLGWTALTQAFG